MKQTRSLKDILKVATYVLLFSFIVIWSLFLQNRTVEGKYSGSNLLLLDFHKSDMTVDIGYKNYGNFQSAAYKVNGNILKLTFGEGDAQLSQNFYISNKYLISAKNFFEGTIPNAKKFNAIVSQDTLKVDFVKDGTFKVFDTSTSNEQEVGSGTYTRKGNVLTIHDKESGDQIDWYIYNNKLSPSVLVKE